MQVTAATPSSAHAVMPAISAEATILELIAKQTLTPANLCAYRGGCKYGRWGIMLQRWGIMLQVVGALCFKWWMRMREVVHYASEVGHHASEVGFECCRIKVEQIQDAGEIRMHSCTMFLG